MTSSSGFNKSPFTIAEPDRVWVEDNYRWLTEVYGYTVLSAEPVIFNKEFFPVSFSEKEVLAENILADLQSQLHLEDLNIRLNFWEDLRDTEEAPYEIQGKPFESGVTTYDNHYQLTVAKSLEKLPGRLLFNITYQLVCIKLIEDALLDDSEADASLFVYLAGVYMGFGVILSRFLHEAGTSNNGLMETSWHYGPDIPYEVMGYALAIYSWFSGQYDQSWQNELPEEIQSLMEKALGFLEKQTADSIVYDPEFIATALFEEAFVNYEQHDLEGAVTKLEKALFLTEDLAFKADIYNGLGYFKLRKQEIQKAINYFYKAIEADPAYGYALDNLGYALIRNGAVREARQYLNRAEATGNNDAGYHLRNMGLYYQYAGNPDAAEECFQKALSTGTSVDLLEYHYGEFLLSKGNVTEGVEYIKNASEKGEWEAVEKLKEIRE